MRGKGKSIDPKYSHGYVILTLVSASHQVSYKKGVCFMSKRLLFRLLFAATMVVALTAAFLVTAPSHPAHAAGCSGASCYTANKDYIQEGCNITSIASTNIVQNGVTIGRVDNYYSSSCIANWVQGVLYGGRTGLQIWVFTKYGPFEERCYPDNCVSFYNGTAWPAWSNLVDGHNVVTACGKTPTSQAFCVDQ